jgi:hypothetical protein
VVRGSNASKLTLAGIRQATIDERGLDKRSFHISLSTSFPRPTVARRIADAITLLLCLLMVTGIVTSFW